jgi:hypothetical protein
MCVVQTHSFDSLVVYCNEHYQQVVAQRREEVEM